MKKLTALLLALVMVLAIGSTALASAPDIAGDVYKDDSKTTTTGTNIPLNKSIVFFNLNGSDVYEPNISYTYAVTPFSSTVEEGKPLNATVTDDGELNIPSNDPVTVTVNNGITGGVGNTTITFSSANNPVAAAEKGAEIEKSSNLTVNLDKFKHAGIYRYKITETYDHAPETVGMDARTADYSNERYLDVYIKNNAAGTGLELSGAVIFKTDAKDESSTPKDAKDAITTTTDKTTGFEPGVNTPATGESTIDYTNDKTVDRYTTYDFTVTKEVAGGMADKTNEFPFYVNITNTIDGAQYTYVDDPGTGTGSAEAISGTAIAKGLDDKDTTTLHLKHGDSIKFIGVPSDQTQALSIDIKEWNNTPDGYTPSASATNGTASMVSGAQMNTGAGDSVDTFDLKTNDVQAQILKVTNTIAEISPTGVVLRFAPYAIMLGAGVALFIILKVRKNKAVEEA